jgi:hypothetical protein
VRVTKHKHYDRQEHTGPDKAEKCRP